MPWELTVEAPGGAKPVLAEPEGEPDGEQGAADWREGSKHRADVEVDEVDEVAEEPAGNDVVCVSVDDGAAEEYTKVVDVSMFGKGGPVTVVAVGKAIDTVSKPLVKIVTVAIIVDVELHVVGMPDSVVFGLVTKAGVAKGGGAGGGVANSTVAFAAVRLDIL